MNYNLIFFVVIQLLNVIVSTFKSILTVEGSKHSAALINAVSYTFFVVTTKLTMDYSFEFIIITTFLTNYIGVYFSKWYMEKRRKERLWTITATIRKDVVSKIELSLKKRSVKYAIIPAYNDRLLLNMFSYSKAESLLIKEILDKYKVPFAVTENLTGL